MSLSSFIPQLCPSSGSSKKCVGQAKLFRLQQASSTIPILLDSQSIYHRIEPSDLDEKYCYFMDNTNHVRYPMKCMGVLVALCSDNISYLGFIVAIDDCFKVALCNDTSCFFNKNPTKPMSSYFNLVISISFDEVFSGKYVMYYVNQLNGFRCFRLNGGTDGTTGIPPKIISSSDKKYNMDPDGPDIFSYDCFKNNLLFKLRLSDSKAPLLNNSNKKSKKNRHRGHRERHIFRYNINPFQQNVTYMNYDFRNSINVPSGRFGIPYTNSSSSDHNGIHHRKFAYLTKKEVQSLMRKCPLPCKDFDSELDKYESHTVPYIDPYECPTNDFAISKSFDSIDTGLSVTR